MNRMLDDNIHFDLPEADVAAFFKAELATCVEAVRRTRMIERMDGSLTEEKARCHRLEAIVLRGLVEDGLREEMPPERLSRLPEKERAIAQDLQAKLFREFISPAFNTQVQVRAKAGRTLSQLEALQLRWAAVEARMAALEAVENVPLHNGDGARDAAVSLLRSMMRDALWDMAQDDKAGGCNPVAYLPSPPSTLPSETQTPETDAGSLTPGVTLIEGRMNGRAILAQFRAARRQPFDDVFDGAAGSSTIGQTFGEDIAGTAVRMTRRSKAKADTKEQRLKSVVLFMFLTGVQRVSEIRQHHLDRFSRIMERKMPRHYWKSDGEKDLTSFELIEQAMRLGKSSGLTPATIERHVSTVSALIEHARSEGNLRDFIPNLNGLIPVETRADDEKREVFTQDALKRLFSHPLWQGCKSKGRRHTPGVRLIKDHHYWINLTLAYTGARRSEVAGLLESDFGEESGIPYVYLRANHIRGLKNTASKRRVPLHPHLMELGFAEFVETCRKRKRVALFPEAIPAHLRHLAHRLDGSEAAYDKKFADVLDHMLRTCLERSLGGNPTGLSCHSMRHYVNDHLLNLRQDDGVTPLIPETDRKDVLGHKPTDVNVATYRRAEKPLGPLYHAINTLPRLF